MLYTGLVDGPLTKRGTGFASMSWDANDDLWASQNGQVVMFRGTQNDAAAELWPRWFPSTCSKRAYR